MLFISDALAETANAPGNLGSSVAGFVPLILIFLVFYFLIIRPQQKKAKDHSKMLDLVKKGDKVVITHSIMGSVTKVDAENAIFSVEIANDVVVKVLKTSISEVLSKIPNKSATKSGDEGNVSNKSSTKKNEEVKMPSKSATESSDAS